MCEEAWIEGKTNHSLRATGVTEMYLAGVPEKVIQEHTGHQSLDGLRSYERSTLDQHQTVCNIALSSVNLSYSKELNKIASEPDNDCTSFPENICTAAPTSNEFEVSKSLSTLFSCSGGGTFHFSPSGNVVSHKHKPGS